MAALRNESGSGKIDLRLLKAAVEATGEAILITTAKLDEPGPRIGYANAAFVRLSGYLLDEVIGRNLRFLQGPETERTGLDRARASLDAGGAFQGEALNYRKDGSGFGRLYELGRKPGPIREAACWAHAQRKFFELADLKKAPIAIEAVTRIDAIFAIERAANGLAPDERCAHRCSRSTALVTDLEAWLRENCAKLSAKAPTAAAIDSLLKRWTAFTWFLDDGRICLSNNAAERTIRPIAVGRRNWTFAGSDAGGHRTAAVYMLIETAKLNNIDTQAWLADHPARRIDDLLPWNWTQPQSR